MDPNNAVVKLCAEGMRAEMEGRPADARTAFVRAWEARGDAFEACVAAHYVARHQDTPDATHRWNAEALAQADAAHAAGDDRVRPFYPSLYLNAGHSCELLGDAAGAARYYDLAEARLGDVPGGTYGDVVRHGVAEGRRRAATAAGGSR